MQALLRTPVHHWYTGSVRISSGKITLNLITLASALARTLGPSGWSQFASWMHMVVVTAASGSVNWPLHNAVLDHVYMGTSHGQYGLVRRMKLGLKNSPMYWSVHAQHFDVCRCEKQSVSKFKDSAGTFMFPTHHHVPPFWCCDCCHSMASNFKAHLSKLNGTAHKTFDICDLLWRLSCGNYTESFDLCNSGQLMSCCLQTTFMLHVTTLGKVWRVPLK